MSFRTVPPCTRKHVFKNNIQRTRPLTDLADEYSTLFEEQLAAFEKERAKMKQDHDEKLDSLTSQLRKLKEDNATAKAEIECYKNQINRNGESFYMSQPDESLTHIAKSWKIFPKTSDHLKDFLENIFRLFH